MDINYLENVDHILLMNEVINTHNINDFNFLHNLFNTVVKNYVRNVEISEMNIHTNNVIKIMLVIL